MAAVCKAKNPATCRNHGVGKRIGELTAQLDVITNYNDFSKVMDRISALTQKADQAGSYYEAARALQKSDPAAAAEYREKADKLMDVVSVQGGAETASVSLPERYVDARNARWDEDVVVFDADTHHPEVFRRVTGDYDTYFDSDSMQLSFSRELTEDEVEHVKSVTEYMSKASQHKEVLFSGNVPLAPNTVDFSQTPRDYAAFEMMVNRLEHPDNYSENYFVDGTPVRITNRAGANTAGTRAIEGMSSMADVRCIVRLNDSEGTKNVKDLRRASTPKRARTHG